MYDFTQSAYDRKQKRAVLGTHGAGMCIVKDNKIMAVYDDSNSPLTKETVLNAFTQITGLAVDKSGNIWISNFGSDSALRVLTISGKWYAYKMPNNTLGKIAIDQKGNKWIASRRDGSYGLILFNENGTFNNYSDDRIVVLTTAQGSGSLPSNNVLSIAGTKDGDLWIGTDQGLARIRNTGGPKIEAERIIVGVEAGTSLGGYLLGDQVLNDIKIDGADRRWVATNNGSWLIDSDGRPS
jgi:ligand-binding sensor domain-containing protein